jgi:hypothetical protein
MTIIIKNILLRIFFFIQKKISNTIIDRTLIILLRSNHPKRYYLEYKKFNSTVNFKSLLLDNKNYNNLNLFIGDSHSEFYGRNFSKLDRDKNLNLTYWLGPILLLNFLTSKKVSKKIINFVNFINNKVKYKKLNIILSFGEIDIRNSFYQILKVDKSFRNTNELFFFIKKNLMKQVTFIKNNINVSKYNLFFHDIQPTPNKKGICPKNKWELAKIKKKIKFPVLGSLKNRVYWRKKLVDYLFKNQDKIGIKYIRQNSIIFDRKNNAINLKFTKDKIHTHDSILLFDYQNKVNKYKK